MNKENIKLLLQNIKYNIKKLKRYDKLETKEEIQIIKYDVPVEYFDFKEQKTVNFYNFYATMMGIIDNFIDRKKYEIENNSKNMYRIERELEYAYSAREDIANNLIDIEIKLSEKDKEATKSIRQSILEYPAHKNFDNIYDEARVKYSKTHIDFINEYYKGYYYSENFKFRDIIYVNRRYQELFKTLCDYYLNNELKIEKARTKEKQKKYVNYF